MSVMDVQAVTLSSVQASAPGMVLVVDDDPLIRMDVAGRLRDCGFEVIEAEGAAEAIDILNREPQVRLIFSDVQMPGELDGFGLARWVNANRPQVPVILASGVMRAEAAADALCQAAAFIEKPFREGDIAEAARRVLGLHA